LCQNKRLQVWGQIIFVDAKKRARKYDCTTQRALREFKSRSVQCPLCQLDGGVYQLACVGCCGRLLLRAGPQRKATYAAVARFAKIPQPQAIKQAVREYYDQERSEAVTTLWMQRTL